MDLLDLLFLVQPPMGPRRSRSPGENVAYGLATLVFPMLMFVLVLFVGLWAHPMATFAVGLGFVAATAVVARVLGVGVAEALQAALACSVTCLVFGGVAFFLGLFGSFLSGL